MGLRQHDHGTAGRSARDPADRRRVRRRRCGHRSGTDRAARAWPRGSPARRRRPRRTPRRSPFSAIRMPTRVGARSAISSRSRSVKAERPRAPCRPCAAGGRSAGRRARRRARACCAGQSPRAAARSSAPAIPQPSSTTRSAIPVSVCRSDTITLRAPPWRAALAIASRAIRVTFSRSCGREVASRRCALTAIEMPNRSPSSCATPRATRARSPRPDRKARRSSSARWRARAWRR